MRASLRPLRAVRGCSGTVSQRSTWSMRACCGSFPPRWGGPRGSMGGWSGLPPVPHLRGSRKGTLWVSLPVERRRPISFLRQEVRYRQIALARVVVEAEDSLAGADLVELLADRLEGGARAY